MNQDQAMLSKYGGLSVPENTQISGFGGGPNGKINNFQESEEDMLMKANEITMKLNKLKQ